ncbi:MAG: hypothetical protein ACFCUW_16770 [Kiloniellaceae bacterium]
MFHAGKTRLLLVGAMLAIAGLTAACESAAERQARLDREAYIKSLDVEELKESLETVNPEPFDPDKQRTRNIGRFKQN